MKNIIPMNEETASKSINPANKVTVANYKRNLGSGKKKAVGNAPKRTHVKCFNCGCKIPAYTSKSQIENYKKFVLGNKPYNYYIKLTLDRTTVRSIYALAIIMLHQVKCEIFKDWGGNEFMYLDGVTFIESHTKEIHGNDTHKTIHILVKHDNAFYKFDFSDIKAMFETAANIILHKNKHLFKSANIDVQEVKDDSVIEYGFKSAWNQNLSNVRKLALLDMMPSLDY